MTWSGPKLATVVFAAWPLSLMRGFSVLATNFAADVAADVAGGDITDADTTNSVKAGAASFADHRDHVVRLLRRRERHGLRR